jgi:hypothetical protein
MGSEESASLKLEAGLLRMEARWEERIILVFSL